MSDERKVRLARKGRNQAVGIAQHLELSGGEAVLRNEGRCPIVERAESASLLDLLNTLSPIDEEFPEIEDKPAEPVDL